jgi:hypothetical protein
MTDLKMMLFCGLVSFDFPGGVFYFIYAHSFSMVTLHRKLPGNLSLPSDCSPVSCDACIIVDVYQPFGGMCPVMLCGVTTQKAGV